MHNILYFHTKNPLVNKKQYFYFALLEIVQ